MIGVLRYKDGVLFDIIAPGGFEIIYALKRTATALLADLTITSGTDGEHSGPTDPHKRGEAYDVRSHDFSPEQKQRVLTTVMGLLGVDYFYGFLEDSTEDGEHFHFQVKRGTAYPPVSA